jgi:Transposase DDE domain
VRLKRVTKFIKPLTKDLLTTQKATLSQVSCGMLGTSSLALAEIARGFETEVAFSHNLKRVARFVSNPRISQRPEEQDPDAPLTVSERVARRLVRQLRRRLKLAKTSPLEIILDWTSVKDFQVLSALVGLEGRAVPVLQWSLKKWELKDSQNAFEYRLLLSLRRIVGPKGRVLIVADRGFGRTELFRFLDELGFLYCIRVKGDAWVEFASYAGKLRDYEVQLGQTFKLPRVRYHKHKRYDLKLAITCTRIKGKAKTWLLATNLPSCARQIVDVYRRRFWCEENFRDLKQAFGLEKTRVETAERLDALLLAASLVFLILALIGVRAEKLGYATKLACRKKGKKVLSWCALALKLLRKSTKYLNLLFDNTAGCLGIHWA